MYNNVVLRLFESPKNAGRIMKPDGIASLNNADNTANVEFSMRIEDEKIVDCKFRAQANPYIIAVCSTITTRLIGKNLTDYYIDKDLIFQDLGYENIGIDFCLDCVKQMIEDYTSRLEKTNEEIKDNNSKNDKIIQDNGNVLSSLTKTSEIESIGEKMEDIQSQKEENDTNENLLDDLDDDDFGIDFSDLFDDNVIE